LAAGPAVLISYGSVVLVYKGSL